jgi:hypothetical protein
MLRKILDGHNMLFRGADPGGGGGVGGGGIGGGGPSGPSNVPAGSSGPAPPGIKTPAGGPTSTTINMGNTVTPGKNFTVPIPFGSYSFFGGRLTAFGTYSQQKYSSYNTMCTVLGGTNPGAGGSNGVQALANKTYGTTPGPSTTLHGASISCTADWSGANYDFSIALQAQWQQTFGGGSNLFVGVSATFTF